MSCSRDINHPRATSCKGREASILFTVAGSRAPPHLCSILRGTVEHGVRPCVQPEPRGARDDHWAVEYNTNLDLVQKWTGAGLMDVMRCADATAICNEDRSRTVLARNSPGITRVKKVTPSPPPRRYRRLPKVKFSSDCRVPSPWVALHQVGCLRSLGRIPGAVAARTNHERRERAGQDRTTLLHNKVRQ